MTAETTVDPQVFPSVKDKLEGGRSFVMETDFTPAGDQPTAIVELTSGISDGEQDQVLLGARPSRWQRSLS